jgi:hypothetical protein
MNASSMLKLCFVLFVSCLVLSVSCFGSDIPSSPNTIEILNGMDEFRSKKTSEDVNAAKSLNKEGDKAYKQKKYPVAYRSYYNSYPNYPNAYAYIMSGDTYWRMVASNTNDVPDEHHCRLGNEDFPHRLDQDISQTYEVGIALAVKDKEIRLIKSDLYKRAVETDRCLRKLVDFYKTQAADVCIDAKKIQACLGKPLIK